MIATRCTTTTVCNPFIDWLIWNCVVEFILWNCKSFSLFFSIFFEFCNSIAYWSWKDTIHIFFYIEVHVWLLHLFGKCFDMRLLLWTVTVKKILAKETFYFSQKIFLFYLFISSMKFNHFFNYYINELVTFSEVNRQPRHHHINGQQVRYYHRYLAVHHI